AAHGFNDLAPPGYPRQKRGVNFRKIISVISYQLSGFRFQLSGFSYQASVISFKLSVISFQFIDYCSLKTLPTS
ncbi:MAG: hypothetical protein ACKPI8_00550, partial [Microcystis panniformis]